jgi:hypothetical protein
MPLLSDATQTVLAEPRVPAQLAQQVETSDGARAIEVAAVFDNAVLDVRHFDSPSAGRMSGLTKGLLGSAGAALLGTFALFADSYVQVAAEKAAQPLAAAQHKKDSGRTRDAAAGGLLFFGAGALLYGLYRAGGERKENEFSIGSAPSATFKVESQGLPSEHFPLVRSTGTDYEFLFTDSMSGELHHDGKTTTLSELAQTTQPASGVAGARALRIPEGARLSVNHQGCSFIIRSVARPRHYPVPLRIDWNAQSYTGAVLAGAAATMALMFATPPDPRSLALDSFTNEQLARYLVKAPEVKEEQAPWLKQQPVEKAASGGKAARDKSGRMGNPESVRRAEARPVFPSPKTSVDPKVARRLAEEAAKNNGILALFASGQVKGLTSLMQAPSGLGDNAKEVLAALDGQTPVDAYGAGGMGFVGVNRGGNGNGEGTIGLGNIPGVGPGPGGPGGRSLPRAAALACRDCGKKVPDVKMEQPTVINYDRDIIRRIIRQHMNEVKYCYEKELVRDNKLAGRVVVKFFIGNQGTVTASAIESSTVRESNVEQCIAGAVRRWEFPRPQGGLVSVSYPFVLKSTGE